MITKHHHISRPERAYYTQSVRAVRVGGIGVITGSRFERAYPISIEEARFFREVYGNSFRVFTEDYVVE